MVSVALHQVLAWRMQRQLLAGPAGGSVIEIVRRLCGVQAQVASAAELAIGVRQRRPERGAVERALWEERSMVKTWAMRGTLHLLPVEEAGAYLALAGAVRFWERASWQKAFGATPADVAAVTEAVAEALDGAVLTREELVASVVERTRSGHLEELMRSGWGTLLKPAAWQGFICHGPPQGGRVTFTRPDSWVSSWRMPAVDDAAPVVIRAYLGAYGPATADGFDRWLTRGTGRKPLLRRWFADVEDDLAIVDVEGTPSYLLAEHVDDLAAQAPVAGVRLLPGFDQYVLGPGTGDVRLIPSNRRALVSRTAGWIAPVVVAGGRIVGVWDLANGADRIEARLWEDIDAADVEAATDLLGRIVGRTLVAEVTRIR